ncbi:LysR family transcriptional regulator [Brevibacterium sp. K11IcPPYGO002]|uniref:LysR substrate-binding domain-containing protein n=1 Tax=Brevibacterium sp. K11IcPPYGO002 TaxID=3058837 RepID=UPI003D8177F9
MNLDVETLRSFAYLADELHFGRAALALGIEQPTLSQRIKRLEDHLEVELFVRSTRRVELSTAGQSFRSDINEVLTLLDRAIERARAAQEGRQGKLTIFYTMSVGYEFLPKLVSANQSALPGLAIDALEMWERDVIEGVLRGRADLGLVRTDPPSEDLSSTLIAREKVCIAIPRGHRLCGAQSVELIDLKNETFFVTPQSLAPGYQGLIDQMLEEAGVRPKFLDNPLPGNRALTALRGTQCLSILPKSVANNVTATEAVTLHTVTDDSAWLPVRLLYRAKMERAVTTFLNVAAQKSRSAGWMRPS